MEFEVPVVKMLACLNIIRIFLYSFCGCSMLCEKRLPTFPHSVFCRAGILQESLWNMLNFSFVWVLSNVVVVIICWHERLRYVLHGTNTFSFSSICLTCSIFLLCLIVFVPVICPNNVFLWKDDRCCFEYISEHIIDI